MKRLFILIAVLMIVGCSQAEEPAPQTAAVPENPEATPANASAAATPTMATAAEMEQPVTVAAPTEAASSPAEIAATETVAPLAAPIEVTYFTPSQQEGPYYTVNKPEDRDNDLVVVAGADGLPEGQILEFGGTVYDANGLPIPGITIEIWQTDGSGVYLHPNDPGTSRRDPNFQFYGEAVTDVNGRYDFRTILPGLYEPRPRHIHVKVKLDGQELLTTQFYFAGEVDLRGDDAAMLIATKPAQDTAGTPILVGQRDIILNYAP